MKSFAYSRCTCTPVRLCASALAIFAAFPVLAQSPAPAKLGEVVVTATRTWQTLSDVLADVTIVDSAQLERSGATGLADVLTRLPGVEIQRNGGVAGSTSVYVRGGETRFTAVYIDGVRIDSQSTGGATWESIPLGQIDRIEVLRGPAAAVYGSDALSGVIQIFTRRGEGGFAPYLGFGLGSNGLRRLEAGFSGSQAAFDYSLGLLDEQSDGFNITRSTSQNPDRDGHDSQSANLKLGWQINAAHRLEATYLNVDLNAQYDAGLGRDDHSLHALETIGLNWSAQWSPVWFSRLSASTTHSQYKTLPAPSYLTLTELGNFLWHNEFRLGQHLVTADLERRQDHLENAPINATRSQNALALGYGFQGGPHTVQLNARHDDDSEFGGKSTASAAYGYALSPQWRLTASAASAFRVPTLYQRFSVYGMPSLKPETSDNMELGLRYAQGDSHFGAVVYRNKVSNLISFSAPGGCASSFGCYANTTRAVYQGLTLTAGQHVAGVALSASLDVQDPHDAVTGKQLARRARQHATLAADTQVGAWALGADVQLSGKRFDNAANTLVLAGYGLINLRASTAIAKDWSLVLTANNLTDKDYQLANGYATPGRSFYAGLKWAPQ